MAALQVKYLRTNIITATKVCNSFPVRFEVGRRAAGGTRATLLRRVIALREFFVRLARRCLVVGTELRLHAYFFLNSLRPASLPLFVLIVFFSSSSVELRIWRTC